MKFKVRIILCVLICSLFAVGINGQADTLISYINNQIDSGNHYIFSDIKKAEQFYLSADTMARSLENDSLLAAVYVGLGVMERMKGNYPKAFDYYQKSMDIHQKLNDSLYLATDYHNIGILFRFTEYFDKSKKYLLKAIQLRTILKDSTQLGISYNQLGVICRKLEQLDSAAYYYERAYHIFEQLDDRSNIVSVNGNWATLEYFRKNYQRALEINLEDVSYLETLDNHRKNSLAIRYHNIAKIYRRLGQPEIALPYINKAIVIGKEERYLEYLTRFYNFRSNIYKELNDYEAALGDYKQFRRYRDTVNNVKRVKEFTEQRIAFEYEQERLADSLNFVATQAQLELMTQSERSKKNFYLALALLFIFIGVVGWYFLKNKRKLAKVEAELLQEKLKDTQKEAEFIVGEQQFRLEQKKMLTERLEQLSHMSKDHKMMKQLNLLALDLNIQLHEEATSLVFEENFSHLNVAFEEKLIKGYPTLTKNERELCKLIWMNKSIAEIMELKNVSSASVRSMRYRIRKKLGLLGEVGLEQFLKQL